MVNKKYEDVLNELNTSKEAGLTTSESSIRLEKNGYNQLESAKRESTIIRFFKQFKDMLVIVLLAAAVINVLVAPDDWVQALIIVAVVLLNATLGIVQENKAEKSLEALKKLSSPQCKVIRDGVTTVIDSKNIVVGDILLLEAGDFVPADARIIESHNMKIDESPLTGESVPVDKLSDVIAEATALGDMKNMVFSSTFVTYGRGKVVVTATGMNTEIGKIAQLLNAEEAKMTPLQIKLDQIGKMFAKLAIVICVLVFLFQLLASRDFIDVLTDEGILQALRHPQFMEAVITAIALAVAAIPEALAAIVTIILSIGVSKMVKQNAIVKKLPAVETLGCTSIVCSDKTGTLTQNKMTVVKVFENNKPQETNNLTEKSLLLSYAALCSDAVINVIDGQEVAIGDPTETALIAAQMKFGSMDTSKIVRVRELPFDSDRKLMSVIVKLDGKFIAITKGAPDVLLKIAKKVSSQVAEENAMMAKEALRVLAVAVKEVDKDIKDKDIEKDLNFVGLIGMIDPERPEAKEAIKVATEAGIKTIMITGDHVVTATAIATKLEIFQEGDMCVPSDQLQAMTDDQLDENIEKISVYARVAPADKVRIVKAWQRKGKVVSMTGDGVNDSPSLKAADIGCAMGITGTDVSKESADMILTDDNFATIIKAVEEGRNIYDNIKKCVKFIIASNLGEVLTIFLVLLMSLIFGRDYGTPLLPIHLLWINLVTDSLPAFALGMERAGSEIMNKKPRSKEESFFADHFLFEVITEGIFIAVITIVAFLIGYYQGGTALGQTLAFLTLSSMELFHAFNLKTSESLFNKRLFDNKWLIYAFLVGTILNLVVVYTPLNNLFAMEDVSLANLGISMLLASTIFFFGEFVKLITRKFLKH